MVRKALVTIDYPTPQKTTKPSNEIWRLIDGIDLEPIRFKIKRGISENLRVHADIWMAEDAKRYRKFLFLAGTTGEVIIPTTEIDRFWHHHILDTRKYSADCEKVFGFYLHHFPYLGLRGDADEKRFADLTNRTAQIWEAVFGERFTPEEHFEGCG